MSLWVKIFCFVCQSFARFIFILLIISVFYNFGDILFRRINLNEIIWWIWNRKKQFSFLSFSPWITRHFIKVQFFSVLVRKKEVHTKKTTRNSRRSHQNVVCQFAKKKVNEKTVHFLDEIKRNRQQTTEIVSVIRTRSGVSGQRIISHSIDMIWVNEKSWKKKINK